MIAIGVFALPFDDPAGFTAPAAFGPFRVLHQIGSGVLGPVFRTFDPHTEKLVAVKVFRLDVVPEVSAQLAHLLKRLAAVHVEHPAVVPLMDAGLEGTTAFLAMEYVASETLDVSMRRLAPAGIETALPILRQVAEAMETAWSAGVGHGALHPRDVFVMAPSAEQGDEPDVRVTGFGVAEALEELRIPLPARRPYVAPEREQGAHWDVRADVYSLGVIAHELLTGRRPTGSPEQDCELPPDTPLEERILIRRALSGALAQDLEQRFGTPMAFVKALATGAVQQPEAEALSLPWPAESEAKERAVDDSRPELQFVAEPDSSDDAQPESQPEADATPEPEAVRVASLPAWPEQEPARTRPLPPVAVAPMFGVQAPPERRPPFHPNLDAPKEDAMPRTTVVAVLLVVALASGAFGYWLRGPGQPLQDEAVPPASTTNVPVDEPIGTDVTVNTPAATPTPPQAAPASEPAPAQARRAARVTPAAARVATTGSLRVETRPGGATVLIDGKRVGRAPLTVPGLKAGAHTIRLTLAGYKTMTTKVVVRAGQQTPVRVSLEIQ